MCSDLAERDTEKGAPRIATTRRRIPWRIAPPVFVKPNDLAPADLTLHALRGRRVFVCGDVQPGSAVAIASAQARKCYTDGHFPLVVADNGTQVTYAASWWGDGSYGPARAADAWAWLEGAIQREWRDPGARLLLTPATTGRDLLARLAPEGDGWPVMSADVQAIIRATAGQGRMQTIPGTGDLGPDLFEYDARMAYVALLRELPIGDPEHYVGPAAEAWATEHPYHEGRYRVTWTAPAGWSHPGILPAHGDAEGDPDWVWPLHGTGWCGGAELFTALRHGWSVTVHEGYCWPRRADPFRTWTERLLRVLAESEQAPAATARMLRNAVRAIVLHTVGSIHGAPHRTSEYGDNPPDGARHVRLLRDGRFAWEVQSPPAWPEMVHPEWSATVWGRSRARLVSSHRGRAGFVTVDPSILVAFRTDAIYTTRATGWDEHDDGTPGRYRMVRHDSTGVAWPRNGTDVLRVKGVRP